jgi:epoxyqueuosine reductase
VSLVSRNVKEYVKELGADLVGILSVDLIADENIKAEIKALLKDARTVIVFGRRLEHIMIKERDEESARYLSAISKTLKLIARKLVRFIFTKGFSSKILSDPVHMREDKGINIKKLAEIAGLGQIGFNNLFLTPEYGPRILITAVVTDAQLEPDERNELPICLELKGISCKKCADACPQLAISFTGRFYEAKCRKQLDEDVELYQAYCCTFCVTSCPVGHPDSST